MVKDLQGLMIFLFILGLISGAQAATIHGIIYEWSDFDRPLKNAVVDVNSTPAQYIVASAGNYSFNLPPGNYLIRAKYYRNNVLELVGEENITIDKADNSGDFVHDLLLFPPTETEFEYLGDINLTTEMEAKPETNLNIYILVVLILVISGSLIIYWRRKRGSIADAPVEPLPENFETLPDDLRDLHARIMKMGGRTTQKELRKELNYSEAKVSLMLDDLENRGFIKKIRKGRSNIIIAESRK